MKNNIKITVTNVETGEVDTFECTSAVIGMIGADGIIRAIGAGDSVAINIAAAMRAVDEMRDDLMRSDPIFKKALKFYRRNVEAVKIDD